MANKKGRQKHTLIDDVDSPVLLLIFLVLLLLIPFARLIVHVRIEPEHVGSQIAKARTRRGRYALTQWSPSSLVPSDSPTTTRVAKQPSLNEQTSCCIERVADLSECVAKQTSAKREDKLLPQSSSRSVAPNK